jgi:hypothetical protein
MLLCNDDITHLDDHVIIDNGTRCNLEHDIQRFSYPTT